MLPGEMARDSLPYEEACNLLPETRVRQCTVLSDMAAMSLILKAEERK